MYKKLYFLMLCLCFLLFITAWAEQPTTKPIKEYVKISLELTNMPITTAIAQIAKTGNFSVVISPEVPNTMITATFKNVPAELALQTVCDAAGLMIQKKEANVYLISPKTFWDADISKMMREMVPPTIFEAKKAIEEEIAKHADQQSIFSIITCPKCKKQFRGYTKERYCPNCGAEIHPKCKSCGRFFDNTEWRYCPYCGKKITQTKNISPNFVIMGTVKDAVTGKPIVGAKVSDDSRYAGGKQGSVTDAEGKYRYNTWYEEHDIIATAPGYKPQKQLLTTSFFHNEKEKIIDFILNRE